MISNEDRALISCTTCGRDTYNTTGICDHCKTGGTHIDETKDRELKPGSFLADLLGSAPDAENGGKQE